MNTRIRELINQAEDPEHGFVLPEKLVELVVQECENSIKLVPTHFEAQDKIIVECLKAIRETFRS